MEQTAEPGTLQVTEETKHLVEGLFEFEDLGGIEVKPLGQLSDGVLGSPKGRRVRGRGTRDVGGVGEEPLAERNPHRRAVTGTPLSESDAI